MSVLTTDLFKGLWCELTKYPTEEPLKQRIRQMKDKGLHASPTPRLHSSTWWPLSCNVEDKSFEPQSSCSAMLLFSQVQCLFLGWGGVGGELKNKIKKTREFSPTLVTQYIFYLALVILFYMFMCDVYQSTCLWTTHNYVVSIWLLCRCMFLDDPQVLNI